MGTTVLNDTLYGKLQIQLWDDIALDFVALNQTISTTQNYTIMITPTYGSAHLIHMIVAATSGKIDISHSGPIGESPIGLKPECSYNGATGVIWHGITDPLNAEVINFRWTPATTGNGTAVKFSATTGTDYLDPVYQRLYFTGGYADKPLDTTKGSIALAVLIALMLLLPITILVIYCGIKHAIPYFKKEGFRHEMVHDEDEDYGKSSTEMTGKSKRKDKFEKLDEAAPDRD